MILVPHGQPPTLFTFSGLAAAGVPHATTTRHFPGLQPWSESPHRFTPAAVEALAPAGLDLSGAAWARQVHGADVAVVSAPGFAGRADALVTTRPAMPLAIFTADCLALVLVDPRARVLAAVHAGWRGTVGGAGPAALAAAREAGARPDRLRVAISPSIGPCCYEVDEPVIARLASAHPAQWERWVRPARPGHFMLDLWTANEELLGQAGVRPAAIENPRLCTACHADLLYSYRKGNHGRLLTVAALPA
jgi:YfiH family protein